MIPHGQIQTKKVKKIAIKDEWYENINGYGNTIYFTDDTKGELYGCQDKERTVKAGDSITFKTSPSRFDDKPNIIIVSSSPSTNDTQGIPQQSNNNPANENTDEEVIHSSVVKEFKLKNYASSQSYYSHFILFENGHQGELSRCTEKKPLWLKKGALLNYWLKQGKKADMPFIVLEEQQNQTTTNSTNPDNKKRPDKPIPQRNPHNDFDFRFTQQKCISITTCLDRANELVIAGVIDNDKRYEQALQDLNFIFQYSGINERKELIEYFNTSVAVKNKKVKEKENKNKKEISQPALFNSEEIHDKKEKKK